MPILPLPLEISEEIISVLAQDDPSFSSTKACALVCHRFRYFCRKHIFASIALNDRYARPSPPFTGIIKTTTPKLQKLLDSSPEIADHIRNLTYNISSDDFEDDSLIQTFRKITRLKYFCVWHYNRRKLQWDDNPLRPVLLHLLHLPTLIHFKLFDVDNFLVSDLAPCLNLEHFEFDHITVFGANDTVTSTLPETSIRIRNMSAGLKSAVAIMKMCVARRADGKPLFDFSHLNELSINLHGSDDVHGSLDLLRRCKQLTRFGVDIQPWDNMVNLTQIGLAKMLHPSMRSLKHLQVNTTFNEEIGSIDPLCGLCNELEEMANKNAIETITIIVDIETDSNCARGDEWGRLDTALGQPGWPKLQRVSLAITIWSYARLDGELERALGNLPQTQFHKLTARPPLVPPILFSILGSVSLPLALNQRGK